MLVNGTGAATSSPPSATGPSSTFTVTCEDPPNCPITINDNAPLALQDQAASPYPSEIGLAFLDPCCEAIEKVTVTLTGLTHGSLDNVDVLLVREANQTMQVVELMSDAGGSAPVSNLTLTFDDSAPTSLPSGATPVSGTYKPTNYAGTGSPCVADNPPSAVNGDPFPSPAPSAPTGGYGQSLSIFNETRMASGVWRLYVGDDCVGGSGSISSWSLTFTTRPVQWLHLAKAADASSVSAGLPIGFGLTASLDQFASIPDEVTLSDPLPAGPGIDWSISPPYTGPGSCSITGAVGTETLSCDFGVLEPGGAGASVHLSSATTEAGCGTYSNTATLSSLFYPSAQSTDSTTVRCPTAVRLASFVATRSARGVLIRWRSASEARTLGFNVYREQNGQRVKLNRRLIPGRRTGGRVYSWLDRAAPRQGRIRYWLQAVSLDGTRSWYGPRLTE